MMQKWGNPYGTILKPKMPGDLKTAIFEHIVTVKCFFFFTLLS